MSLKGLEETSILYKMFEDMHKVFMGYTFKGESLPEIVKAIYKTNSGNDSGAYVEPLMEIIAASEGRKFKPIRRSLDVEFVKIKKAVHLFLIYNADGEATCKIKPAPLIQDFISALEKQSQDTDYKFELVQCSKDDSVLLSHTAVNPLYTEFKFKLPEHLDLNNESKIRPYMEEEHISNYICVCALLKRI